MFYIEINEKGFMCGNYSIHKSNVISPYIQADLPPDAGCYYWDNGEWVLDKAKQQHNYNSKASSTRESAYATQIDPLHARKQRKLTVGTWTEDDEATYVAEVKQLSVQIETDNPYMEEV